MLRSSSRRLTRVIQDASVKSLKPRVTRRFASGHGGAHQKSSDLPWAVPSLVITVPVCFWLYSTTPMMEPDHRRERKASRDEARKAKEAEEEEHEEEEKPEEPEEKEQATGEDNVEASAKKTEAADASDDDQPLEPTGKGDIYNKQEGVSNMPTKPPRRTASAGPDEDTHEPTAKDSLTVDPSGKSDTKTKLEKVDGDDKKDDKKGKK